MTPHVRSYYWVTIYYKYQAALVVLNPDICQGLLSGNKYWCHLFHVYIFHIHFPYTSNNNIHFCAVIIYTFSLFSEQFFYFLLTFLWYPWPRHELKRGAATRVADPGGVDPDTDPNSEPKRIGIRPTLLQEDGSDSDPKKVTRSGSDTKNQIKIKIRSWWIDTLV